VVATAPAEWPDEAPPPRRPRRGAAAASRGRGRPRRSLRRLHAAEQRRPADGAVDITTIQPRREAPRRPRRPRRRPVAEPQWVQVATGRDVAALEFDWRRIKRSAGGLLDRYKPHVAAWGQTNRLVAGPFASASEAQDFVAKLKDKQLDSFRFTSAHR
jgi:hypothetical protein